MQRRTLHSRRHTVAAGRIGTAVLRRLKPFDVKLHYTDRHRLPAEVEKELNVTFHEDRESLLKVKDLKRKTASATKPRDGEANSSRKWRENAGNCFVLDPARPRRDKLAAIGRKRP